MSAKEYIKLPYLRVKEIMKKRQKFVLYQVKVRLFYSEIMEARYIARVRVSDIKRTLQTSIKNHQ